MTSLVIGVLAEDQTDGDTLRVLIRDMRPQQRIDVKRRHGGGGGEILRKGAAWAKTLALQGCTALLVVHDLDRDASGRRNSEAALRQQLERIPWTPARLRHFCIPVQELEAWFWADQDLLNDIAGPGKAHAATRPDSIVDPKEKRQRLGARGLRYATTDNPRHAEKLNHEVCAARCPSFRALRDFILEL